MIKKIGLLIFSVVLFLNSVAQINYDQTNLKTSVTNLLSVNGADSKRFEIASVSTNSYHWQNGGIIIVELFQKYFGVGYEKYIIENGYAQFGTPKVTLVESRGMFHGARVVLGDAYDLGTMLGDYRNYARPIYVDINYFNKYFAKISYLQDRVDVLSNENQIKVNLDPVAQPITTFEEVQVPNADILTTGYVGLGINNIDPNYRLSVNGKIRAREIKVEASGWPDYVFEKAYQKMTLPELEKYISLNGHLPDFPSAKHVEKNGVELGEISKALLKNQEELTLHLIEQRKIILDLQQKIISQQKRIENLLMK